MDQTNSPNPPTYKIRGTKVTSPYPVALTAAETRLIFSLQHVFDPENIFPDYFTEKVTLRTQSSSAPDQFALGARHQSLPGSDYVQIDCLTFDHRGVFVFESKDHAGWIYGNADQISWTSVLNFGREKHHFYNPLRQNSLHLEALADFLDPEIPLYSIIVFGSDSTLKTSPSLPAQHYLCTQPQLRSLLSRITTPHPLSAQKLTLLRESLLHHRVIPTTTLRREHITAIESSLPDFLHQS